MNKLENKSNALNLDFKRKRWFIDFHIFKVQLPTVKKALKTKAGFYVIQLKEAYFNKNSR